MKKSLILATFISMLTFISGCKQVYPEQAADRQQRRILEDAKKVRELFETGEIKPGTLFLFKQNANGKHSLCIYVKRPKLEEVCIKTVNGFKSLSMSDFCLMVEAGNDKIYPPDIGGIMGKDRKLLMNGFDVGWSYCDIASLYRRCEPYRREGTCFLCHA